MKVSVKQIIQYVAIVLIIGILIAGNVVCAKFSGTITSALGGTGENFGNASEALAQSDALCQRIEEEGIVLLKNKDNALPLKADERKINIFGYGATQSGFLMKGVGSGSSTINDNKAIYLAEAHTTKTGTVIEGAFQQEGFEVNEELYNIFKTKSGTTRPFDAGSGNVYRLSEPDMSNFTSEVIANAKAFSDVALLVISRDGGENVGEIPADYLDITKAEQDILDLMTENFSKVIVVLNTTNTMHAGFLEDNGVSAAISVGLTGQSGTLAIPRILKGEKEVTDANGNTKTEKISPSGKLADTMTYINDYDPSFANHEVGSNGISYREGIYFGYKWYETADKEGYFNSVDNEYGKGYDGVVQYPFGFGLSYSNFDWKLDEVSLASGSKLVKNAKGLDSDEITIKMSVLNKGTVPARDVVELYYTPPYTGAIEKAEVNLLDFAKTLVLEGGQSQSEIELSFSAYDLASYDITANGGKGAYVLEKGDYTITFRTDAHTLKSGMEANTITYTVDETIVFDKDPVSEASIENRFVGDNAYANMPIDASTIGADQNYMTRSDFEGTFPKSRVNPTNSSAINSASRFIYDGYDEESMPTFGGDNGLSLMTVNGQKPTRDELEGKGGGTLEYDMDLLKSLKDYDSDQWDLLLDQLTAAEAKNLVENGGFRREIVVSVGKPVTFDYDGPAGFNTNSRSGNDMKDAAESWTAFTSEALMGQTWNKDLMFSLGRSMGAEASATKIYGWYAPGVNLHRSAYNARNYEYYSEDAVLSGKLAAQTIYGAKTNGLICYLKHFVCSEEGPNPRDVSTWLTEQNLRENYLRPFEIAVKEGGSNGIMTAFNRVGAVWCGANKALVTDVLRGEWGFKGVVITDWTTGGSIGGYGCVQQGVRAGNDLWLNPNNITGNALRTGNAADMYCARQATKNILYAQVDTVVLQDSVKDVDFNDIKATIGVGFKEDVFAWWIILLVILDIIGFGGCIFWAVWITLPIFGINVGKKQAAEDKDE